SSSGNVNSSNLPLDSSIFTINRSSAKTSSKKENKRTSNPLSVLVIITTFLLLFTGAFFVYKFQADFEQFQLERIKSTVGFPFLILATTLFLFKACVFLYKVFLYFKYKPIASVSDE